MNPLYDTRSSSARVVARKRAFGELVSLLATETPSPPRGVQAEVDRPPLRPRPMSQAATIPSPENRFHSPPTLDDLRPGRDYLS